jgi:hypothetical protein
VQGAAAFLQRFVVSDMKFIHPVCMVGVVVGSICGCTTKTGTDAPLVGSTAGSGVATVSGPSSGGSTSLGASTGSGGAPTTTPTGTGGSNISAGGRTGGGGVGLGGGGVGLGNGGMTAAGGSSGSGAAMTDGGLVIDTQGNHADDKDIAATYSLETESFSVPAGGEVFKCQSFANPFKGKQVDIKTWEAVMNPGSHHMFVFYSSGATDSGMTDCSGLQIQPFTFVAQSPHVIQTYPATVGATIPTSMGFQINAHYLNTSSSPIMGHVKVNIYVAKDGLITQHAGIIFNNNLALSQAAGSQGQTFTKTCPIGQAVTILSTSSHMHHTATHFTATVDGMPLYDNDQWSDPPQLPPPGGPIKTTASSAITFACTYGPNTTGGTLTFGESSSNIMCIMQSVYYPATDINSPFLGCYSGF